MFRWILRMSPYDQPINADCTVSYVKAIEPFGTLIRSLLKRLRGDVGGSRNELNPLWVQKTFIQKMHAQHDKVQQGFISSTKVIPDWGCSWRIICPEEEHFF